MEYFNSGSIYKDKFLNINGKNQDKSIWKIGKIQKYVIIECSVAFFRFK